jgi:MerR family transcriptional regulator, light-induced transcriptional regulator
VVHLVIQGVTLGANRHWVLTLPLSAWLRTRCYGAQGKYPRSPAKTTTVQLVGIDGSGEMNLKQAAASLGVHYMTAYRYVRTGRLRARRVGTEWVVGREDLRAFSAERELSSSELSGLDVGGAGSGADWRNRLRRTLVAGDETAAWRVLEQALAAGHGPAYCYLGLLVGAIDDVTGRSTLPTGPIAEEYLATATAARLVARLGARFRRPGRSRGTVVFGAVLGEHHTLAISIVADLVRLEGFTCLELGANVPPEAFAGAAAGATRLVAVGVGVTTAKNLDAVRHTVDAVHAVDPAIPVVLGGQAAAELATLGLTGAEAWAGDGLKAVEVIAELAKSRRSLWLMSEDDSAEPLGARYSV